MFRVCFDDEDMIPGYFSGRIRRSAILDLYYQGQTIE
uniref:Translational initiation factor 1 n=1 Tax=Ranunculus sceleratus TaxID=147635 RepID=A0A5P9RW98_9MAGN|nr:translational initiation factor 1 [Ranunculus sceleratus]